MPEHFTDWPWRHWAQQTPDAVALQGPQGDVSWSQVAVAVQRQAARWRRAGVLPGCGVALMGQNSLALLLAYLAALECGARVAPLNPRLPAELLARRLPTLDLAFGYSCENAVWPSGIRPLDVDLSLLSPARVPVDALAPPAVHWNAQRLATLTLTSGSSGLPKAAAHRYAAHLCSAAGVVVQIPTYPISYSGDIRSVIPIFSDHPFQ